MLEMIGAILLIVPALTSWTPSLTPIVAALLLVETLALCAVYGGHSLKLSAENPLVWSVVMALLVGFVAYGRYALKPLA